MDSHIFKILQNNLRISLEFKNNLIVTIFKDSQAWYTEVHNVDVEKSAKQLKMTTWDYREKLKEYIINTPENVECKFNKKEFVINYKSKNDMKLKYFACKLESIEFGDSILNLLEKFYSESRKYYKKFQELENNQTELQESKVQLENKLKEFVERKVNDEQELYNDFVMVLNEKKQQIQHLSELLEAFRRGRPTVNAPAPTRKRKAKPIKNEITVKQEISDSESANSNNEQEYNTDDEKNKDRENNIDSDDNLLDEVKPSTSRAVLDVCLDDSPPTRYKLPKRVKRNDTNEIVDVSIQSISKEHLPKSEPKSQLSTKVEKVSQNATSDTQDLLDLV